MPTACEEASFWIGKGDREERKKTRNLENRVRIIIEFITNKKILSISSEYSFWGPIQNRYHNYNTSFPL